MVRLWWLCFLLLTPSALAHKLAPSLLNVGQTSDSEFSVLWKTPIITQGNAELTPILPASCEQLTQPKLAIEDTAELWRWQVKCSALIGEQIKIDGMAQTDTASLIKMRWLDGHQVQQLLNINQPDFIVPEQQSQWQVIGEYVQLGAEHIAIGIDHLLFVLALLLLVPNTRRLILTITAFTLGHSVTLSLVVLGYFQFNQDWVELLIAASIFALAIQLSLQQPVLRHSPAVAAGFGLLHGMGFASALQEVGLPLGDIPLALFSFNVGIEIGQIIFVLIVLALIKLAKPLAPSWQKLSWSATVYVIGSLSVFWCIERGMNVLA